jgi:HAD superfamily hydrolase (TIGR01509 family)
LQNITAWNRAAEAGAAGGWLLFAGALTKLPAMSNWPGAILFDFDGVIVNSEPLHFDAFRLTLAKEHIDLSEEEYYKELIGFDDKGAFRHVFQKHGRELDPKTFLRVMTSKSEAMMEVIHQRRYEALPGVEELVRGLWRHYPLAICSGALREEIEAMLEGVRLRDCFPTIVAAEDVSVGKPDPMGYLMTAKLVSERAGRKLEPKDCLIVEDAPSVIQSVRAAGFCVLAVATSYVEEELAAANYVVRRLEPAEVLKKIPQLLTKV